MEKNTLLTKRGAKNVNFISGLVAFPEAPLIFKSGK
jgi:hypothetical protein